MNYEIRNQNRGQGPAIRACGYGLLAMGWHDHNPNNLCQSVAKKYIFVQFVQFVATKQFFALFALFAVSILRALRGSIRLEYRLKTLILPSLLESFSLCD